MAPWVRPKVRWVTGRLEDATAHLEPATSILAIHACGDATDRCLDVALACRGHVAVMPCCYRETGGAPAALHSALGAGIATDVHRTYRLEAAGYAVQWTAIPVEITPMNRSLVGQRAR